MAPTLCPPGPCAQLAAGARAVRHAQRAALIHAATTSVAHPAGGASDGTCAGQLRIPLGASGIGPAAAAQPGHHRAGVSPSGPPSETSAWCRESGLALAARPWVGGHILVTTQTGLNSDGKHAPASRAGASVAPKKRCVALSAWLQGFAPKETAAQSPCAG